MTVRKQHPLRNCPYCSIRNLRGAVGVKAHIRHMHRDKMVVPGAALTFAKLIGRAEQYEGKARAIRLAASTLVTEGFIE